VGGFAMRDDDWEVTRLASLQPIRAEQIGYCWRFLFCCRYGIALGGDSDARHVTSQLGRRVEAAKCGGVARVETSGLAANWGCNACVGCIAVCCCCCCCCSTSGRFPLSFRLLLF
jgi:hypothetical protein